MWYRVNTDDEHAMDNTEPSVGDQSSLNERQHAVTTTETE